MKNNNERKKKKAKENVQPDVQINID